MFLSTKVLPDPWTLDLPYSVEVPFWVDDASMLLYHREYVVVSVVMHSGLDNQGHCQAGLMSPQGWFLQDDNRVASIVDPALRKHRSEIVFVWLVQAEQYSFAGISSAQHGKDELVHLICCRLREGRALSLLQADAALRLLRTSCGACGCLFFGSRSLEEHVKTVHPGYWLELRRTYQATCPMLKCYDIPCAWCCTALPSHLTEPLDHYCAVALNAAVCQIYHQSELQEMGAIYSLERSLPGCGAPSLETWLNH